MKSHWNKERMWHLLALILAMTLGSCGASISTPSPMSEPLNQSENLNTPSIEIPSENQDSAPSAEAPAEAGDPKQSSSNSSSSAGQAIDPLNPHLISIVAVTSDGFSSYWKVTGECSHDEDIIKLEYSALNGGSGITHVPCFEGYWLYNDLYGNGIQRVTVTHGTAKSTLNMNNPVTIEEAPVDCPSNYTWRHEITDVFGQSECHAIAYCPSGRPYMYSDTVSTQCAY